MAPKITRNDYVQRVLIGLKEEVISCKVDWRHDFIFRKEDDDSEKGKEGGHCQD